MRPLQLTMQAFGSYGRETSINFEKPDQNLFLITGDTGAGKTTIFDAIVFALYGEASSNANKKDGVELQSHFVELDVQPFVELIFSEGSSSHCSIYTVRRIPKHQRLPKRGTKIQEKGESVSLMMPDGSEYPQKEADKKLEEIVGLTKAQFMQVAMIAQGEFMELLRAKSKDKKIIFRKLFNTELFQKIADELGRRKKAKEREIATIRTICQTEITYLSIPEEYEQAEEIAVIKDRIITTTRLSVLDMEQLMELLERLCTWLDTKKKYAESKHQDASRLRDEKRDNYTEANQLLKFFKQKEEAQQSLHECEREKKEIEEIKILITQLRAAYEIEAEFKRYEDAFYLANETEISLKKQEASLPLLQKAADIAIEKEQEAKAVFEAELERFSKISERVGKALELFQKIEHVKEDINHKEQIQKKAEIAVESEQKRVIALKEQEQNWKKELEELGNAKENLAHWEISMREVSNLAREAETAHEMKEALQVQEKKAKKAKQDYLSASEAYEKKNDEYERMRKAFLDEQAGFLAKELQPGRPCPVCGSLEHPSPCQQTLLHKELSRENLEQLGKEVDSLRTNQEQLAAKAMSATNLFHEKEGIWNHTIETLLQHMAEHIENVPKGITLEQAETVIMKWGESVKSEGAHLKGDVLQLNKVQKSLNGIDSEKEKLNEAVEQAKKRLTEISSELMGNRIVLESLQKENDFVTIDEANRVQETARKNKDEKADDYKKARMVSDRARNEKETAETLIKQYQQQLPNQVKEAEQRKEGYQTKLEQKHLSETQWKKLIEIYDRKEADELQKRVNHYNERRLSSERLRKSSDEAINNRNRPNLSELEQEKEKAEQEWRETEKILKQYEEDAKTSLRVYHALCPKMEERKAIVNEYTRLDTLYKLISGNVTGSRMDLETYVQRYYLERILYAANRRLYDMSAGQFELQMYELEEAGEGTNKGLDLMVYSTVTRKAREVRTLSGGESFMAALSLALGMADQIQETSAAINLDMMFIDEGFGSLDEHSRNQAIKVLQEMAGGSKLIGIISHVTELKHEIEDQLIVTRDESGSHAIWQIS